tara:strand:- start:308 stop:418 length:111 start_codon:yes stop_codon:yes gene_type:complete
MKYSNKKNISKPKVRIVKPRGFERMMPQKRPRTRIS